MNKRKLYIVAILIASTIASSYSQVTIKGTITGEDNDPIPGANIYLKDTYDGTSSKSDGTYQFTTYEKGTAVLLVNYISYETYEMEIELNKNVLEFNIQLEESVTRLEAVTISAGMFEAGDEKKAVVFNSLDIATIAGAGADIVSAMATLPGANIAGGKTGLYVRGGEGREAQTFIDGMRVAHPFYSEVPDVSQRGRFSPFLFQGTYFSTGGYSAEYGQGLSSALILNSMGLVEETFTSISLMSLGLGGGYNHAWDKTSLGVFANYTNLNPYTKLVEQNFDWTNAASGYDASLMFRRKTSDTGLLKAFVQFDYGEVGYKQTDLFNYPETIHFNVKGNNFYSNVSYREQIAEKLIFTGAFAYERNDDDISYGDYDFNVLDDAISAKVKIKYLFGKLSSFKVGAESQFQNFEDSVTQQEKYYAAFAETDLYLTKELVFRLGVRGEYSQLVDKLNAAPRLSLAYKTGDRGQVSIAYGKFYQAPERYYLYNTGLNEYEESTHYILNYQILNDDISFRIETYYKKYDHLLLYGDEFTVDGFGDASGIDLFWRDKKTIPNADYWISYSWLDTKRKYLNYPVEVMPDYAIEHNLSFVYKHFIPKLMSNIGFTYVYNSGRPYFNPNNEDFLADMTKDYHNISLNMSWIHINTNRFTVVSASVSNIFGFDNVYGYHYTPDGENRIAVKDVAKRFYFIGVFISIGRDNTEDI